MSTFKIVDLFNHSLLYHQYLNLHETLTIEALQLQIAINYLKAGEIIEIFDIYTDPKLNSKFD